MVYKILKNIVSASAILTAVLYGIIQSLSSSLSLYDGMILTLLILIATTSVLEGLDDDRKWEIIKHELSNEISSVANCKIKKFSNSYDWVRAMEELTKNGMHIQDTASLDSSTRSKSKRNHNKVWSYINHCCADEKTTYRHIIRIRKNNFEHLLDRIISGSANKNTYFAYYELNNNFSFPTFGIIDNKYVSLRSPYNEGSTPCYMIIENIDLVAHFNNYFIELWSNSTKINNINILLNFYEKFKDQFTEAEKKRICEKIGTIREKGIIDDI